MEKVGNSGYKAVAIISHGGPIRFVFREILGIGEVKIDDCGIAELTADGSFLQLVSLDGIKLVC